jgi:hypothetical protein
MSQKIGSSRKKEYLSLKTGLLKHAIQTNERERRKKVRRMKEIIQDILAALK